MCKTNLDKHDLFIIRVMLEYQYNHAKASIADKQMLKRLADKVGFEE